MSDGLTVNFDDVFPPSFYQAHNDITQGRGWEYWFAGGRGSGKSTFIANEILFRLMDDARRFFAGELSKEDLTHAIAYRKVGSDCRDSVLAQFERNINRLNLSGVFRVVESQLRIYFLPTMQMIRFRGLDDDQKQKSVTTSFGYYKYLWFEEVTQFKEMKEIRSVVQSVIRGGKQSEVYLSYNPPASVTNWVNTESATPKEGRFLYRSDYRSVPVKWIGEPFIREAEALKRQNPLAYRHEYLGEITGTGSEIFSNVKLRRITQQERDEFRMKRYGLDFGFENDPTALILCAYDAKHKTIFIFGEWVEYGQFEEGIHAAIKARGIESNVIIADSSESRAIARLQGLGCRRMTKCYKRAGWVDEGLVWMRSRAEIIIDPVDAPNAAREFTHYEYERLKDGTKRNEYPDRDNHTIDATRYALENDIRYGDAPRQF